MKNKICPNCHKQSFSAISNPDLDWTCPYCKQNLAGVQFTANVEHELKKKKGTRVKKLA